MPVRIYTTNAGTDLSDAEAALLADLVARHGRAVSAGALRLPSSTCAVMMRRKPGFHWVSTTRRPHRGFARCGSLWAMAAAFVDNLQRQMLFSDMVDASRRCRLCSRFRAARARCACSRAWPATCCRAWRGRATNAAAVTAASPSPKATPRLVCSSFCVPTRAVWTVEIWSSPARPPTLWPDALAE